MRARWTLAGALVLAGCAEPPEPARCPEQAPAPAPVATAAPTTTAVDDLVRVAHDGVGSNPEIRAIIKADRRAWGHVVQVIDRLKQGGIARLAFAVSPLPVP
jgi:PBP1b-binding outer membrane lipoprotein LpoB